MQGCDPTTSMQLQRVYEAAGVADPSAIRRHSSIRNPLRQPADDAAHRRSAGASASWRSADTVVDSCDSRLPAPRLSDVGRRRELCAKA